MVLVTVLRRFADFVAKCDRNVGDQFEATEKRAAYIDAKLPGYIKYEPIEAESDVSDEHETEPEPEAVDLTKLTVASLKALAAERGIEVPKSAKKAQIIALLEE
jgi:hypothetical protein